MTGRSLLLVAPFGACTLIQLLRTLAQMESIPNQTLKFEERVKQ
jgi:hypothetical protein